MKRISAILIVLAFASSAFTSAELVWKGHDCSNGLISPNVMGITLPHEHLLIVHKYIYLDLTDEASAITELGYFANAGGKTLAEASAIGIGRNPEGLKRISTATGVNVIMCAGYYKDQWIPDSIKSKSIGELRDIIINDIIHGINGIHAGFIKIAMSRPISPFEEKVLIAAARAQVATGAAIEVHFDGDLATIAQKHHVLDVFESEGVDLSRVCLNHAVPYVDLVDDLVSLAQRGCYLAFDMLGLEIRVAFQQKLQLSETLNALIDAGYINQILMSQDVCFSVCYVKNGGYGYAHILKNILPQLKTNGISDEQIHTIMVDNPKRMFPFKNPEDYNQCVNETFTAITGTVTDNSGNAGYGNNMSCEKLIQPAGAVSVILSFNSFATESGYDFVRVYDGSTASSPLLGEFSGTSLPAAVTSTGGSMLIVFTTDGGVVAQGWSATYTGNVPVLTVTPETIPVSPSSGTTTIRVISNIDWSANEGSDWLTLTRTNDTTLAVTFNENKSIYARSAEILVSGEGVSTKLVKINQTGASPALSVAPASKPLSPSSGAITFIVHSNIDWWLNTGSGWLTAAKTNDTTLVVIYNENKTVDPRFAEIIVGGEGVDPQSILVNQGGESPVLYAISQSITVSTSPGTSTIKVFSNIDWSFSENSDWLTATKTNDTILTVSYDENTIVNSRSCEITMSGPGVASQDIMIIQDAANPELSISQGSVTVGAASGTTSLTITSNIDWSVNENSQWFAAIRTDINTLLVIYDENRSAVIRSEEIVISGEGIDDLSVIVSQEGAVPTSLKPPSEIRQMNVYPNPVSGKTMISYPRGLVKFLELYEPTGHLIIRRQVEHDSRETEIDFSGMASGIYLYRVIDREGNIFNGKILKE